MNVLLNISRSSLLAILYAIIYLSALVVIGWVQIPICYKLLLAIIVVMHAIFLFRKHVFLQSKRAITKITKQEDQDWCLETADGKTLWGELVAESYLGRYLVILNFRLRGQIHPKSVLLCKDAVDFVQLRRLRVYLSHMRRVNG